MSFVAELKRRNVFRVGIAYVLMGWVLLQGADFVLDLVGAPEWVIRALAVVVVVGLPIALFFAWAFELTPEGIKREHEVDRSTSLTSHTGRKLDFLIIGVLVVVIALMAVERLWFAGEPVAGPGASPMPAEAVDAAENPAKTIAVLPFADLSQGGDHEWFADGLAEEILNALTRTPDLLVSSRTSSFRYKDTDLDISQIAGELGVAHVLEGSVRAAGGRLRVTAQLIRAADGFHVWSQTYDRDEDDMIGIQEDLARSIATALETTMDPRALAEMTQAGTRSVEAYREYLKGVDLEIQAFAGQAGAEFYLESYRHFERARALDPGFARAHQRAAEFWKTQLTPSRTDSGLTELTALEMLAEFSERIDLAIESAPTAIDRVRSLGSKAEVDLRLRDAVRLYSEYLAERPNDEWARFDLATVAEMAADREAVLGAVEHWREKGTRDVTAANAYVNTAYRHLDASPAADFGLDALERWPRADGLLYQTHRTLMWAGRITEGKALAERYYRQNPEGSKLVAVRQACAEGRRADAETLLAEMDPGNPTFRNERWHVLKLLGREREAEESLRPLEESGVPYQLASQLTYHKFDPRPFPSLMQVLEREEVNRLPPADIPFRCPEPTEAVTRQAPVPRTGGNGP